MTPSKRFIVASVAAVAAEGLVFQWRLSPTGQFVMTMFVFWAVYRYFNYRQSTATNNS